MKTLSMLLNNVSSVRDDFENAEIVNLVNDSRDVIDGALFLAYPGNHVDGRDYIQQAIENGAAAICYDSDGFELIVQTNIPCVPVKNLKQHEALIAAQFYDFPSQKLSVIGVTGTNGKTSVTHFLSQALGDTCAVIGTTGYGFLPDLKKSLNTTPDGVRLQSMIAECADQGAKYLAMEVSSHALAEKRMAHVQFETAVFTNLTREHLDFHKTMENYRDAKAQLFQQTGLKNSIINIDDPAGRHMIDVTPQSVRVLTYSTQPDSKADIVALHFQRTNKSIAATITTPWGTGDVEMHLLGEFNLQNVLAVIGVLGVMNIPFDKILKQVSQLTAPPGRMTVYHEAGFPVVAIDYAHTPDALEKALTALRNHGDGKVWCVFGCGGERDHGKRAQMGEIAERLSDRIVITNDNPRGESPEKIADDILSGIIKKEIVDIVLNRAVAIQTAVKQAAENDLVLVAGKGHETTQVIGDEVLSFSDVGEVSKILKKLKSL